MLSRLRSGGLQARKSEKVTVLGHPDLLVLVSRCTSGYCIARTLLRRAPRVQGEFHEVTHQLVRFMQHGQHAAEHLIGEYESGAGLFHQLVHTPAGMATVEAAPLDRAAIELMSSITRLAAVGMCPIFA